MLKTDLTLNMRECAKLRLGTSELVGELPNPLLRGARVLAVCPVLLTLAGERRLNAPQQWPELLLLLPHGGAARHCGKVRVRSPRCERPPLQQHRVPVGELRAARVELLHEAERHLRLWHRRVQRHDEIADAEGQTARREPLAALEQTTLMQKGAGDAQLPAVVAEPIAIWDAIQPNAIGVKAAAALAVADKHRLWPILLLARAAREVLSHALALVVGGRAPQNVVAVGRAAGRAVQAVVDTTRCWPESALIPVGGRTSGELRRFGRGGGRRCITYSRAVSGTFFSSSIVRARRKITVYLFCHEFDWKVLLAAKSEIYKHVKSLSKYQTLQKAY